MLSIFQSTHPLRGGTRSDPAGELLLFISIHPPLAGWDLDRQIRYCIENISIHPPLAGWDGIYAGVQSGVFISIHPPLAGWDDFRYYYNLRYTISIHPPLAGWDRKVDIYNREVGDFNPPTPCGVGLQSRGKKL